MKEFEFLVEQKFDNYKMVDYLKANNVSKEIILRVKLGRIALNGKVVSNVNDRVKSGDRLKIIFPPDQPNTHALPIKGKLNAIYQDEYMLAVVKDKGVLTHSSRSNNLPSLEQLVYGYFSPQPFTFRVINRLDRDTSGIVLIAKDMFTASLLGEQMKNGLIKKTYLAIVKGKPSHDHFIIEEGIKRQSENSMKRVVSPDGQYAKTECFFIKEVGEGKSLLKVLLHTGRTHQIRVHLSHAGLPLYADELYGEKVKDETYTLCADSLTFTHPFTASEIKLTLPIENL